jgi:Flp pilus assembly protein CpaB
MLTAGLLAVLANFALLRSRDEMVQVAAADRDIGRGSIATSDVFHLVEIQGDTEVLSSLVPADGVDALDGLIAARSITAGELISTSDFVSAAAPSEKRAMSIPVDRVHAAGGMISDADVVDVIVVADGVAEYIVIAAPVLDVASSSSSGIGASGQYYVTIAVESLTALRIAGAIDGGSIEIVRSTGATQPTQMVFPEPDPADEADPGDPSAGS